MIKAKHNILFYSLFKRLTLFYMKRRFNSIIIDGDFKDNGESILLISNHISWWDGFWAMYLNIKALKKSFYFMMLEKQLKKYWYFKYAGAYSIKKSPKSIVESLEYTNQLLTNKNNCVLMFPQGEINSLYNNKIVFKKGSEKIIDKCNNESQVVFVVNLIDYFSSPKPNVYIYFKTFNADELKGSSMEERYNVFYNNILCSHKTRKS